MFVVDDHEQNHWPEVDEESVRFSRILAEKVTILYDLFSSMR